MIGHITLPLHKRPADAKGATKQPSSAKSLARCFPVGRLDKAIVRSDGVGISVAEVRGVEADAQLVMAFASALNGLDFPVQFLVRQHQPDLSRLRAEIAGARPSVIGEGVEEASLSLERFLRELESKPGVLDRRYYVLCERGRADELLNLLSRTGLSPFPLEGAPLTALIGASTGGVGPGTPQDDIAVAVGRSVTALGSRFARSFQLSRWPRSLSFGALQRVFSLGLPMDLAVHVVPIPTAQAARTLEWQKVKMESANALSLRRGRSPSPEAEIALEDITRLRDELHRGRERLYHASLSLTVYADSFDQLTERTQELRGFFAGSMGSLSPLPFQQREGFLSTMPLAMNPLGSWRTVDTTSLAYLFPFAPPDLDTRKGTLFGLDIRSGSPVTFNGFDSTFLNANMVVLARSGAGKSFSTKLGILRGIARGITYYVIDPEGEYGGLAEAAGGRVLTPGVPGHGLNPFVVLRGDDAELLQRIGGLRRLVEVMVGERLRPEQRAALDQTLTSYYMDPRRAKGFQDYFRFLEEKGHDGAGEMATLLRTFATGSLRHLLTDDGADLLGEEAPVTVFNLRLLEPELRPAATLVCAEAVWAMATRDPKPRMLVVDEVWSIMQHPEGAAFMVSLAKRARKHQLGLVSITQDVQDFLGEDHSRPIVGHSGRVLLQNSAFKLLLQQDPAALRTAQEAFDLPPVDAHWLLTCPRGEGLFVARGGRYPIRILATPEEQRLIDRQGGPR